MKSPLFALAALAALLAGCQPNGQARTEPGQVQVPGARAAGTALNAPPDMWAAPPRQTEQALQR